MNAQPVEEIESSSSESDISSCDDVLSMYEYSDYKQIYRFKIFKFQEILSHSNGKPKPRSGHRIVHYKGRIYSFGGYNPAITQDDPDLSDDQFWHESKPLFKELWELNVTTGQWRKCTMKGDIPEQLASHTAVCHPLDPGVMLIYGGTGAPFGLTTSNTVVACHLESQQFKKISTGENEGQPMALYGQAVVTDRKGRFFTVGGTSGFTYFMDVNMLDLSSTPPAWISLYICSGVRDEPEPRYRHELCLWENRLYVLGGGTSFSADRFEDLPTFDIGEKRWFYTRTKADQQATIDNSDDGFPEARRCHSTVQIGNQVWIFGGYDGEDVFGDAWQLDLISMRWTRLRMKLPIPVYFHAMTVSDEGKMIMFGGVDDIENNTRTNRAFSAWLKVPSLRSMAWEAVCHYQPDLSSLPSTFLLEEGIPKDCVDMLSSNSTGQAVWG